MGNMQTTIEKDGDGYLAKVKDQPNLFAFAYSEKEAVQELKKVVEMIKDYHLE
jgi:predicted RNase H-like HicB family nuclease